MLCSLIAMTDTDRTGPTDHHRHRHRYHHRYRYRHRDRYRSGTGGRRSGG
jgi:hypothetical protein